MSQPGLFDLNDRLKKLNERDPLISLNDLIEWEDFRATLETIRVKNRKSKAGRKPFDCVLMFKKLIYQHLYNLSDEELEYQIRDRYSFCRFLGLSPEGIIPDARTIWLCREQLTQHGLIEQQFKDFGIQLDEQGHKARKGQIVDASFVDAPKQRNSRDENEQIKNGDISERFESNPNVKRQKDVDARWTKKNNQTFYGDKNHITVDNEHELIRNFEVTSAEVHDS
jgi:IS5 family transposase